MKKFATDGWMNHRTYLWPEGKKRGALAIHEQELADEDLAAARVVVDAEGKSTGGVVDTAVSLEMQTIGKIGSIPLKNPNFGKIPSKDLSLEM